MTLQEIAQVAQVVGVLLVPASLTFVGMQMRQNHAIARSNAQRDLLNQTRDWWTMCTRDEAIFDIFSQGMADYKGLSRYHKARFSALGYNLFHIVEGVFLQDRDRLFRAAMSEGYYLAFLSLINTPGGRQWWGEMSKVGNAELCAYLSARLIADATTLPLWNEMVPFFSLPVADMKRPPLPA